jgi:hypothetical protein
MLARLDAENLFMSKFFGAIIDQTGNAEMGDEILKDGWEGIWGWRGWAEKREGGREGGGERGKTFIDEWCSANACASNAPQHRKTMFDVQLGTHAHHHKCT